MTESQSRDAVMRRLGAMIGLEWQILDVLDRQQAEVCEPAQAAAAVSQFREIATAQRDALRARLEAVGGGEASLGVAAANQPRAEAARPRPASAILQASISAFAEAIAGYSILYATARLMYDVATCDLAERHLHAYIQVLQAIIRLIPDVVGWELRQEGLACRCICPACSLGACLCIRNSVDLLRGEWGATPLGERSPEPNAVDMLLAGWAGVPSGQGVDLRSEPRPGSQLAEAGVHQGDRILSVDGQEVSTNGELQSAIRKHQIGEELTLRIERRAGEATEVLARHVSDL